MADRIDDEIKELVGKRKSSKKRVNSIKKGKGFERTIAHLLTETLGIEIARVPQSGAFSTVHNSDTFSGDLMAVHKKDYLPFALECKHYKEINLFDVLNTNKKTNDIFEWIKQSNLEGKATKKIPFIIFKENRSQVYVLSHMMHFQSPVLMGYLKNKEHRITFFFEKQPYLITPFDNFDMKGLFDILSSKEEGKKNDA